MPDLSSSVDPTALVNVTTQFLDPDTTVTERQELRRVASTPGKKLAYEQRYVDGVGLEQPQEFIRHTLAALYLTGGFTSRESAQQILADLRAFAAEQQLDFDAIYQAVGSLPGARRSLSRRRWFAAGNIGLFVTLITGTITIHNLTSPPLQIMLQLGLLLGVVAAQLLLLHRHLS